jgi:hypothetical protein
VTGGGVGDTNGTGKVAHEALSWRVPGPTRAIWICSDQTSGLRIDQADTIRAVLAQPALGRAGDDHVRKHKQANASEPAGIDNFQNCRICIIEFPPEHLLHVHDRDVCPTSVLEKLGIHDGTVMVHHVGRALVVTQHDIGRVAEQGAVEPSWADQRSADDGIRRIVVFRLYGRVEVDRIYSRIAAARSENDWRLREGEVASEERQRDDRTLCP